MRRGSALLAPFRRGRRLWTLAVLLLVPWLWMTLFTPSPVALDLPAIEADAEFRIAVVDHGYHASVLIEQPRGFALGPPGREVSPFVEYGWGDRRFYRESNFWPHALLAAVLLPSDSVVYVRGWDRFPAAGDGPVVLHETTVDGGRLRDLIAFLENAMERGGNGERPQASGPVAGYHGRFYPGREDYIFWSNCNTWVVRALERVDLADSSLGVFSIAQIDGRIVREVDR